MPRLVVSMALVALLGACSANLLTGHEPLSKGEGHLYWGDETLDWTANHLDPIAHTATIGHLYWGNSNAGAVTSGPSIGRADFDGGDVNQAFVTGVEGACGVALDP